MNQHSETTVLDDFIIVTDAQRSALQRRGVKDLYSLLECVVEAHGPAEDVGLPAEVVGVPVVREQVGGRHGAVHIVRANVEPAAFTSVRTFRGRQDESGCCGVHMAALNP